jgi:hypothetical protein
LFKALNNNKILNFVIKIFVFIIILVVVKNNIDKSNTFTIVNGASYSQDSNKSFNNFYEKIDPRLYFSQQIGVFNPEVQMMEDRSCGSGASLENRKRLRWLVKVNEFKLYQYVYENISKLGPYYLFIVFYSLLLLSALLFIGRIIPLNLPQYLVFLLGVLYIFQFQLSEISYSILELFFISVALYAAHRKNVLLLIIATILAIHNRESGILLPFAWLLFNRSIAPIFLSLALSIVIWLGISNFDIAYCFLKSDFLISFVPQEGQIGFWSLNNDSVSVISFLRLIIEGYVIPIVALYVLYQSSTLYNKKKILIACLVYVLIFLVATPILHHSVKMLFIPFLVLLSSRELTK